MPGHRAQAHHGGPDTPSHGRSQEDALAPGLATAMGDAGEGALSLLEYRYVHGVERPHGLSVGSPTGEDQTGVPVTEYLDNLYAEYEGLLGTRRDRGASR